MIASGKILKNKTDERWRKKKSNVDINKNLRKEKRNKPGMKITQSGEQTSETHVNIIPRWEPRPEGKETNFGSWMNTSTLS